MFSSTFNQPQGQSSFGAGATSAFGTGSFSGFGQPQQQQQQPQQQQQQQQTGTSLFGGGTTQPSTGFGSFGSGGGTQTSTGFGSFGSGGGTQTSTGFGGFGGSAAPQTSTAFGGFGTGGGIQTSTGFGGFGGGTTQTSSGFGGLSSVGGTQTSTGFGAFGSGATSTATSTGFGGFGSGGTAQPSTGFGGFGSGGGTQGSTGFGGFGAGGTTQTSTGFGTFGSTGTTQTSSGFGGFGGGGLFGQQKPSGFSGFSFGQQQQQQPLLGQSLQQPQQQLGQAAQVDEQAAFHQSIFSCCKFGDERDAILANLNYIQACWGSGKGYFNQSFPPVAYNDKNVVYRFKATGYSFVFNDSNEDGQVVIHIKKPHSKVCDEETQFIQTLQNMLAKPNIFFKITGSKAQNEEVTSIVLIADDRTSLRRILATDLASALLQPHLKPHLDNLGIISVSPKIKPSPEQLKAYLDTAPAGLDPRVWKKAQEDNPDPANMIPIPLLGPEALKTRMEAQQKENTQHYERLKLISDEVATIQTRHANMTAELSQLRRRYTGLSHRIIMAIVRLLILQKQGFPYQPEEDELRKQMEGLAKQLNSPSHFRGRLNELMSHVRMQKQSAEGKQIKYSVDPTTLEQIKEFLTLQQGSVKHLVATVKTCMEYVQKMKEDVDEYSEKRSSV